MISDILKEDIDAYADDLRTSSRIMKLANSGALTPRSVGTYVASVQFLLSQTPVHLEIARRRAEDVGDAELARYFGHKNREEVGHDEWARDDQKQLGALFGGDAGRREPARAMRELVAGTRAAIEENPYLYLAYILFAEYFTVVLGPEWIAALESNCGVPRSAMSAVSHHVELDQHHVLEGCREIDALVRDDSLIDPLRGMLVSTMRRFSVFCEEVCDA